MGPTVASSYTICRSIFDRRFVQAKPALANRQSFIIEPCTEHSYAVFSSCNALVIDRHCQHARRQVRINIACTYFFRINCSYVFVTHVTLSAHKQKITIRKHFMCQRMTSDPLSYSYRRPIRQHPLSVCKRKPVNNITKVQFTCNFSFN